MTILGLAAYLLSIVAVSLFAWRGIELYERISRGQSDPVRFSNKKARAKWMAKEILTHSRMLKFTGSGIAHWFVMIGFVSLLGTLITAYYQVVDPSFTLPLIGNWVVYRYFVLFIAWTTGIGIVTLIGVRQITRFVHKGRTSRFLGSGSVKAYYVEATILAVVFCVILLDREEHKQYINTQNIQLIAAIKILVSMLWFIIIAINLNMGVAWHRFLAPFNIFF